MGKDKPSPAPTDNELLLKMLGDLKADLGAVSREVVQLKDWTRRMARKAGVTQ